MRLNRVSCGIVAGIIGLVATAIVAAVEMRFFGSLVRGSLWIAFLGAGGGVLWLADYLGIMARPYRKPAPTLGISTRRDNDVEEDE